MSEPHTILKGRQLEKHWSGGYSVNADEDRLGSRDHGRQRQILVSQTASARMNEFLKQLLRQKGAKSQVTRRSQDC